MFLKAYTKLTLVVVSAAVLSSCFDMRQKADPENTTDSPGVEYAPQMYHSRPYDALTQVVDKEKYEEAYNSAPHFVMPEDLRSARLDSSFEYTPYASNMREPVDGTIRYFESTEAEKEWLLPYTIEKGVYPDDYAALDSNMTNPWLEYVGTKDSTGAWDEVTMAMLNDDCKGYYTRFCAHCHGDSGAGDGPTSSLGNEENGFPGVANLTVFKDFGPRRFFHTITYGKGNMYPHASQLSQEERWKIAAYLKEVLLK